MEFPFIPMKPYFTEKELEVYKKKLLDKKKELEQGLNKFAEKDPNLKGDYDTRYPDFGASQSVDEEALEVASYESSLSLEHNLELRLQDLEQALKRIKKGTYGKCQQKDCDGYIRKERLEIYPEAKFCMRCLPEKSKHTEI